MRELKFRGWHTAQKKMFSADEMGADQLTISVDGRGFVNVHGGRNELSTFYPQDKFIPMQFTGLKDKNGKEIYEGDILKHPEFVVEEVVWQIDGFHCSSGSSLYPFSKHSEVIGNIWETPELLK